MTSVDTNYTFTGREDEENSFMYLGTIHVSWTDNNDGTVTNVSYQALFSISTWLKYVNSDGNLNFGGWIIFYPQK